MQGRLREDIMATTLTQRSTRHVFSPAPPLLIPLDTPNRSEAGQDGYFSEGQAHMRRSHGHSSPDTHAVL
ncbi:hypothetical protein I308_106807 [Cryptococcus tetragattii IND107]|uniref:Uncharacterized protein n=1 Tax=Cryptococcus tetragattii IND107 TaxID=1296105 RepID=A0ABR3BJ22_9TREE